MHPDATGKPLDQSLRSSVESSRSSDDTLYSSEKEQNAEKKGLANDLLNFIAWGLNNDEAESEAKTYGHFSPYTKSKNILVMIMVVIVGFSVLILPTPETILSSIVYAVLLVFVFMNHKWAMVAVGVLFSLDKLVVMAATGSLVGLIFAIVICNQCARAFLVAKKLEEH